MATLQVTLAVGPLLNVPGPMQSTPSALENDLDPTAGVTRLDHLLVGISLVLITVVGTFFNGLSVAVFCRYRDLRSPTNTFILALCVCDFFMSAIGSPIPAYYAFKQTYIKSKLVCKIDAFAVYFLGLTSLYLLAAISVDRYLVIVKPYSDFVVTQRSANLAVAVCVSLGFMWALMPLMGWNEYTLEGIGVACSVTWHKQDAGHKSFIVCIFLFCFIFPFMVMLFCYMKIARKVKQIFSNTGMAISRKHALIENRLLQTIIIMIVVFLVSWLPYVVVSFAETFGSGLPLTRLVTTIPALIAKASCVWNPIIYVAMNANFRSGFISLFPLTRAIVPLAPNNTRMPESSAVPGGRGGISNMYSSVANTQLDPESGTAVCNRGQWAGSNSSARGRLSPERQERKTTQRCARNSVLPLAARLGTTDEGGYSKPSFRESGRGRRVAVKLVEEHNIKEIPEEEGDVYTCGDSGCLQQEQYTLRDETCGQSSYPPEKLTLQDRQIDDSSNSSSPPRTKPTPPHILMVHMWRQAGPFTEKSAMIQDVTSRNQNAYTGGHGLHSTQRSSV